MLTNPTMRLLFAVALALAAVGMTASPARAAMPRADTAENALLDLSWPSSTAQDCPRVVPPLSLRVGSDTILPFKGVTRSEIGDASMAESCVGEDGTVHVTGRAWGSTTITVWTDRGVATYPLSID
jgi:hypothetical protein